MLRRFLVLPLILSILSACGVPQDSEIIKEIEEDVIVLEEQAGLFENSNESIDVELGEVK